MNRFYVIGSLNMDITAYVDTFPLAGETLIGKEMLTLPGGKGGNQAVALARLGATVQMFGKLGNDQFGNSYQKILAQEQIDYQYLVAEKNSSTGIALIEVERTSSQNRIIVIPGANNLVDIPYIHQVIQQIKKQTRTYPNDPHIVLLQLEIPISSVMEALKQLSDEKQIITIVDPAPVPSKIPYNFFSYIDYITPNETETFYLTNIKIEKEEDARRAGLVLIDKGCSYAIIKAGKYGSYFVSKEEFLFVPQVQGIEAVDTTAAGDSFNAGFAYILNRKCSIGESIMFANKVAGLSTTKQGAQEAMPTLAQVQNFV